MAKLRESEEGREEDKRREVAVLDTMEMSLMSLTSKLRDKEQEVWHSIMRIPPHGNSHKSITKPKTLRAKAQGTAKHCESKPCMHPPNPEPSNLACRSRHCKAL